MNYFLQQLVNGLQLGFVYALIALGYTMVYGILKFINFAHSDVFVLGAWISWVVAVKRLHLDELPVGVAAPWWAAPRSRTVPCRTRRTRTSRPEGYPVPTPRRRCSRQE